MILLNKGLENSPGWELVPPCIQNAYLNTPPRGGKKIILNEDDFSLTSEEVRNVFLICRNSKFFEFYSLDVLFPWKVYPHAYISCGDGESISPQEMFKNLEEGVFPLGFVDYNGKVIYF